jgi:hypothetical protein
MKTTTSSHMHGNTKHQGIRALWTAAMILWIVVAANPSFGQSVTEKPHTISYQGTLMKSGAPVTSGAYKIIVTLYNDESGTQSVWSDEYNAEVKDGLFNILLGSGKILPSGIDLDQLYLGVKINGTNELRPLTQIASATTSITVADNSITKDKLATDYVAGISINGKKVTGKGSVLNIKDGAGMNLLYDEKTHSLSLNSTTGLGSATPQTHVLGFDYWGEGGNTLSSPTTEFFGSVNNTTVDERCNNTTALRLQPATGGGGVPNIIGGDINNAITGLEGSTIAGGGISSFPNNQINSDFSFIGSGSGNSINWNNSSIVGGTSNAITSAASALNTFIGGGDNNNIAANGVNSDFSIIVGGSSNGIDADNSSIVGGFANGIRSSGHSFTGGGQANNITNSTHSVEGGGESNVIITTNEDGISHNVISGGDHNTIHTSHSGIVGGLNNLIDDGADESFIGAGEDNTIQTGGDHGVIGGGHTNVIVQGAGGMNTVNATIGGGGGLNLGGGFPIGNIVNSSWGTVGGGTGNTAGSNGNGNKLFQTIAGGVGNAASGDVSVIAGGKFGIASGDEAAILGGSSNTASASRSIVLGGTTNLSSRIEAIVLNGESNTANLAAQLVGGYFDKPRGSFPITMAQAYNATTPGSNSPAKIADDYNGPLFILGNGKTGATSNAFEVSYNGHSTVFDVNGSGGANGILIPPSRSAIQGARYEDNTCYAWADMPALGTKTTADFGIGAAVGHGGIGVYVFTLNLKTPAGGAFTLGNGAVTATLQNGSPCGTQITATIAGNVVTVNINQMLVVGPGPLHCDPVDAAFYIHVFGR